MFNNLDWHLVQQKLLENKKASLGAAGVAAVTLIYFLTRSSNDIDNDINTLPDYAQQDIDFEFTQRFNNKNKNRKRTISDHNRRKRPKPLQNGNNDIKDNDQELKYDQIDTGEEIKYSLLDPTNPNYGYDMINDEDYDENEDLEEEEAFSVDPYYVPFRVNNAKTKRKPDAPFMAMFKMYANKQSSRALINNINDVNDVNEHDMDVSDNDNDNDVDDDEKEKEEEKKEDEDIGSSPPLNPHIPSHSIVLNGMNGMNGNKLNGLDSLRERYYKQELPQSLQPDALSTAFSSDNQKAIQNDLNEDDSLLGVIKQSVQMITHSND